MPGHDFSFGTLLKTFRKRARLTQQQLAEAIGVYRGTFVRWEQGDYLPKSKAFVLELARYLKLDDQETRRLLEASLTALAPYWSVPLPRNPYFTGREDLLSTLHTQLGAGQTMALTQSSALHGLGGVGKTQIALEYAYRHALEYSAIFWIGAETEEQIGSSFRQIAETLRLPEREGKDQAALVTAVKRWLISHSQWLLIWDNLEELDLLDRFLPSARSGAMLLTTRLQALGTLARGLDLFPMTPEEGVLFLLRRAKVLCSEATSMHLSQFARRAPTEYEAVKELVSTLGGLPLALDQAGAYIEETGCSLTDYLRHYEHQHTYLLDRRGTHPGGHPASVTVTFRLLFQQVEQQAEAAHLLCLCAFLAADAIPEELFVASEHQRKVEVDSYIFDAVQFDQALALLRKWSLVQRCAETHTFSLHRLVQVVLREQMSEKEQRHWQQQAINFLNAVFPETHEGRNDYGQAYEQAGRLLAHTLACIATVSEQMQDRAFGILLRKMADYYQSTIIREAQAEQCEAFYQWALRLLQQEVGFEHPEVASLLHGLACLQRTKGKYEQAEYLLQQAVSLRERLLGSDHPQVANSLNWLGTISREQGKYEQAEHVLKRALCSQERIRGDQMGILNALAVLYHELGRYEQSQKIYEQLLHLREQLSGPEHREIAPLLNNLANLYREQGKYEQAEPLCLRALSLYEQYYGSEHRNVAFSLETLATLYLEQGKDEQAKPLYERTLCIFEQSYGPGHPLVSYALAGLACLCLRQGEIRQAERLYQRALTIREQRLGEHHPLTAHTLQGLALLRQQQGEWLEAIALLERAHSICLQSLGNAHPKTVATQALLAQLFQKQADEQKKASFGQSTREVSNALREKQLEESTSPVPSHGAYSNGDPFQNFLGACCERHPRAWCRSADLWQAYERWVENRQERYPLSRMAFTQQLKAAGFRTDRTNRARIWRGITLVDQEIVTGSDG